MPDNVPILRKTEPFQNPRQPDNADIFFKALAARQEQQQMQLEAQKKLADTVLGVSSLMEKKRQAEMENAQGQAMLDIRNRMLGLEQDKLRQSQRLQDYLMNATVSTGSVDGKNFVVVPGKSGPQIKMTPPDRPTSFAADPNAILSPSDAAKLGVSYGTTRGEASAMGIQPLSDKASQDVMAGENALNQIATFERILEQMGPLSENVLEAQAIGLKRLAKSKLGGTVENLYAGQLGNISNLVRDLGERGVLTDRDISRIQNALPGFFDTGGVAGTAKQKTNILRDLIEENQFNTRKGYKRGDIRADKLSNFMARKRRAGVSDEYILQVAKEKLALGHLIDDRGK